MDVTMVRIEERRQIFNLPGLAAVLSKLASGNPVASF